MPGHCEGPDKFEDSGTEKVVAVSNARIASRFDGEAYEERERVGAHARLACK